MLALFAKLWQLRNCFSRHPHVYKVAYELDKGSFKWLVATDTKLITPIITQPNRLACTTISKAKCYYFIMKTWLGNVGTHKKGCERNLSRVSTYTQTCSDCLFLKAYL